MSKKKIQVKWNPFNERTNFSCFNMI